MQPRRVRLPIARRDGQGRIAHGAAYRSPPRKNPAWPRAYRLALAVTRKPDERGCPIAGRKTGPPAAAPKRRPAGLRPPNPRGPFVLVPRPFETPPGVFPHVSRWQLFPSKGEYAQGGQSENAASSPDGPLLDRPRGPPFRPLLCVFAPEGRRC